jgi:hypothetical protein
MSDHIQKSFLQEILAELRAIRKVVEASIPPKYEIRGIPVIGDKPSPDVYLPANKREVPLTPEQRRLLVRDDSPDGGSTRGEPG